MRWFACVDIGGTKVAVALARAAGAARPEFGPARREPTVRQGEPVALALQVLRLVDAVCAEAGIRRAALAAVGVASAGPFAHQGGALGLVTPNLCGGLSGGQTGLPNDWTFLPLEAPLRAALPEAVRLRIENDAIAALEAERRWGALQGRSHCAYVTWSTGVGVGLCVDGRVLHGKHGNAGHAGHQFVNDDASGARCGCGNLGDVEAQVAGGALERRFGRDPAALWAAALQGGDARARAQVEAVCAVMGRMLYNLVVTLDLDAVALGGGVFWPHRDWLLPRLQAQIDAHFPALTAGVRLHPAGLGEQVGQYAAAALVAGAEE
ncbi:glucokinase [Tibeticola sediminis]|uniref:Glucokinase n=1 Tax=Tibeticola sediminis TaxID=1917811 RepID=A0A3N4US08_9BURK|nr:ROK family protein [Tibeticola sediminis]RPE67737.1 glucokinase [Tibeticola sediminis]